MKKHGVKYATDHRDYDGMNEACALCGYKDPLATRYFGCGHWVPGSAMNRTDDEAIAYAVYTELL
jgi:hypothetical protein